MPDTTPPLPPGFELHEASSAPPLPDGFQLAGPPAGTPEAEAEYGGSFRTPTPNPLVEGDPNLSVGDLGQAARGAVSGIAGTPGDVEKGLYGMARRGVNTFNKRVLGSPTRMQDEGTILPTSQDVDKALFAPPQDQREQGYRELGQTVGGLASPAVAGEAARLGSAGVRGAARFVDTATGRGAGRAAESLRGESVNMANKGIGTKTAEVAPLADRAASIERAQQQIQQQPKVAAERAAASEPVPAGKQAPSPAPSLEVVRQNALAVARDRAREAEAAYRSVGASAKEARDLALAQDAKIRGAEQAVTDLEQQMVAKPGTGGEQFGEQLRATTKSLADKFSAIRAKQSGFAEALSSAGDEARVPTGNIISAIDTELRGVRNPALESSLNEIKMQMRTDQKSALSVRSADSLRKYLDSILQTKSMLVQNQARAVDKETLAVVARIKKELVKATTDSWQPYRTALAKWRTLSRPLDIVERNGALRKVLDTDPISTEYATTAAQVTGQIIGKARAGNPVFTRLLAEDPALKDSARLYFTQDLFGKGAVPTTSGFRTWLATNEAPLKQLGLYDEFRDLKVSRETAQRAVDEAKGVKVQTMRQAQALDAKETAAKQQLAVAERVRDLAKKRDTNVISAKPVGPKDGLSPRAAQASNRLASESAGVQRQSDRILGQRDDLQKMRTELEAARPEEVAAKTKAFISSLRDKGAMNDRDYASYLRRVQDVQDKYGATKEARSRLTHLAIAAGVLSFGWEGVRVTRGLLGR